MTTDPDTGKVWRDPAGDQHYVLYSWRGVQYRLTKRAVRWGGRWLVEGRSSDGQVSWSDTDGNFYFTPPSRLAVRTLN